MKNTEYYDRMAKELYDRAYSDGYGDGLSKGKQEYGQQRGIAHCHKAKPEEIDEHGIDLWGWCDCGKPIIGRWAGLANFCPWCGRVIEWNDKEGNE